MNNLPLDIFEKEIEMCRNLSKKNWWCNWGKCEQCGVIPLLYKLNKGILLEEKDKIDEVKNKIIK